jgi:hypothetical protein
MFDALMCHQVPLDPIEPIELLHWIAAAYLHEMAMEFAMQQSESIIKWNILVQQKQLSLDFKMLVLPDPIKSQLQELSAWKSTM